MAHGTLSPLKAVTSGRLKMKGGERELLAQWIPVIKAAGKSVMQKQLQSSLPADMRELKTTIVESRLEAGYMSYTVTVKVGLEESHQTWNIDRRYSDFHSVRRNLPARYDHLDFPPKEVVNTPGNLEKRKFRLQSWLSQAVQIQPIAPALVSFLELDRHNGQPADELGEEQLMQILRGKVDFERKGMYGKRQLVERMKTMEKQFEKLEEDKGFLLKMGIQISMVLLSWGVPFMLAFFTATTDTESFWLGLLNIFMLSILPKTQAILTILLTAYLSMGSLGGILFIVRLTGNIGWCGLLSTIACGALLRHLWVHRGFQRAFQIYFVAFVAIASYTIPYLIFKRLKTPKARTTGVYERIDRFVAPFVANRFVALKSIWVKLGQAISGRTDIVNDVWQKAFSVMQDAMPPDSHDDVEKTLKETFGVDTIEDVFSEFNYEPLASASIAQVHQAVLLSTGEKVAVKVQHRGVADIFRKDIKRCLRIFKVVAWINDDWDPLVALLDVWDKQIERELDFRSEAKNLKNVRELLLETLGPCNVVIPMVHEEFAGAGALVMEFIDDLFKINDRLLLDLHCVNKHRLAELCIHIFSYQMFNLGSVFNCDPHPGNVMVQLTEEHGARLVLLDWGWAIALDSSKIDAFRELIIALQQMDVQKAMEALNKAGYSNSQDQRAPERSIQFFTFLFRDTGNKATMRKDQKEFWDMRKQQKEQDKEAGVKEKGGRKIKSIPEDYAALSRVVGLLRGLCTTLEVELPLIDIIAAHAKQGLQRRN
eukprot:TRINITY_DN3028_c2_g1_i1.p1 TRINITY_DN3028_c2_g1~~TRINITY_DN3028_c2_g1_i1.p1  ORF type:complete len:885 (-),score=149.21 TRINITY_DN3028_c2_g1_i1:119-2416(-)